MQSHSHALRNEAGARRHAAALLIPLICADALLIALHFVHTSTPYLHDRPFSIEVDGGYAELFQYTKECALAIMLALLCLRTRQKIFAVWSLLFTYLLIDDSIQIHERLGGFISKQLEYVPTLYLRAQDFGELTVHAGVGIAFLALFAGAYLVSSPEARRVSHFLGLLLGAVVFFSVFLDVLHIAVMTKTGNSSLSVLEDGGELFAMSALCWYALHALEQAEPAEQHAQAAR